MHYKILQSIWWVKSKSVWTTWSADEFKRALRFLRYVHAFFVPELQVSKAIDRNTCGGAGAVSRSNADLSKERWRILHSKGRTDRTSQPPKGTKNRATEKEEWRRKCSLTDLEEKKNLAKAASENDHSWPSEYCRGPNLDAKFCTDEQTDGISNHFKAGRPPVIVGWPARPHRNFLSLEWCFLHAKGSTSHVPTNNQHIHNILEVEYEWGNFQDELQTSRSFLSISLTSVTWHALRQMKVYHEVHKSFHRSPSSFDVLQ